MSAKVEIPVEEESLKWETVDRLCRDLAREIKPWNPDFVLAVANGGLVPAAILRNLLGVQDVGAVQVSHYNGKVRRPGPPVVYGLLPSPLRNRWAKRVLVVDDIADTGDTLRVLEGVLLRYAEEVHWAVLVSKEPTGLPTPFSSGTLARPETWIVFPWEVK